MRTERFFKLNPAKRKRGLLWVTFKTDMWGLRHLNGRNLKTFYFQNLFEIPSSLQPFLWIPHFLKISKVMFTWHYLAFSSWSFLEGLKFQFRLVNDDKLVSLFSNSIFLNKILSWIAGPKKSKNPKKTTCIPLRQNYESLARFVLVILLNSLFTLLS